jgi:hypothetical protein
VNAVAARAAGGRAVLARARDRAEALSLPATVAGLTALVGVSLLLRTTALHARYWIDEGLSVGIAQHPLGDIPGLLRQDGSPPLYYLLLAVWIRIAGHGEADTHVLSVAFALLCIPVAYLAGRALFGTATGWWAAGLAATSPFLTFYAQETRMYTLVALLSLLAAATGALGFVQRRRAWVWVHAAVLAILVYTHNWGLFLAGAAAVAVGVMAWWAHGGERRALLRDGALAYGAVGLAYVAWIPTLFSQARRTGAPWAERPSLDAAIDGLGSVLGGTAPAFTLLCVCVAGAGALFKAERRDPRFAGAPGPRTRALVWVAVMALAGLAFAWLASQASPAWATRYLAVFLGPLLLVVAACLARAGRLAILAIVVLALFWIDPRTGDVERKSNAHTTAVLVRDRLEPGDLVVATHPEQGPLMRLYLGDGFRWANAMGPVRDPRIMDWRDALARLERNRPKATSDALVATLAPGQRLLLIQPIIRGSRWGAPWTALVRRRAAQWERRLDRHPRLVRVLAAPRFNSRPPPRGVRAVLYEAVP